MVISISVFSAVGNLGLGFWFPILSCSLGTKEERFYNAISILYLKLQVYLSSKPPESLFLKKTHTIKTSFFKLYLWHLFAGPAFILLIKCFLFGTIVTNVSPTPTGYRALNTRSNMREERPPPRLHTPPLCHAPRPQWTE